MTSVIMASEHIEYDPGELLQYATCLVKNEIQVQTNQMTLIGSIRIS